MSEIVRLPLSPSEADALHRAAFEHRAAYEGGWAYRLINQVECEVADSVLFGLQHENRTCLADPHWADAIHVLAETVRRSGDPFLVRDSRTLMAKFRRVDALRRKEP